MPLTYDADSHLKALSPVLDEHAEWFGRVIRQVFYPEQKLGPELLVAPESFDNWARDAQRDEAVEPATLSRMGRLHDDMRQTAAFLLQESTSSGFKPEVKFFDSFVTLYDEFHAHIRRLERDLAVSDSGLDALTGLRSRKVMNKDIERELERRSRRGRPFCLALARIDHYEEIKNMPQPEHDRLMVAASEIIKLCIRSFDDAYRMNDGEFLMCMKQTEMSGGTAGLNRLKKLLEERAPFFNLGGKELHLTMSSCVAEPQPGDQVDELISNMRKDLNRYGGDAETALEYFEISPLQRFITGLDDGSDEKTH